MGHQIREHMAYTDDDDPLSGYVEVDETYMGGQRPGAYGGSIKMLLSVCLKVIGECLLKSLKALARKLYFLADTYMIYVIAILLLLILLAMPKGGELLGALMGCLIQLVLMGIGLVIILVILGAIFSS